MRTARHAQTLRCRTAGRHRTRLEIRPAIVDGDPRTSLSLDDCEPVLLTPLQVGRLRWLLREQMLVAATTVAGIQDAARPVRARHAA